MVLLVFLVDTSASMNQKTCLGTSYLDLAKGAVESFLKIRARDTNARGDRYMLVAYAEPGKSVKAGWRESLQIFMRELKNLQGYSLSNVGCALKDTFDLLNMHRLQSGIDNYGMGRNPYYLEPAIVVFLTDGCTALDINGVIPEIILPNHNPLPGGELTKELFRWDQRLFAINLKVPAYASLVSDRLSVVQPDDLPLSNLCELTGGTLTLKETVNCLHLLTQTANIFKGHAAGKLYNVGSHKHLMQSLESIAQKVAVPGVIINFEKVGQDPEEMPKEGNRPITPKLESDPLSPQINSQSLYENNPVNLKVNGFAQHPLNGEICEKIGVVPNGFPSEPPKIIAGPLNGRGILPSPMIPPLISPLRMRGFLPPPAIGGIIPQNPPPVCPNRLMVPGKNAPPLFNGNCNETDKAHVNEIKSNGQCSGAASIAENPVRGDEQAAGDSTRNLVSPVVLSAGQIGWQNQRRMIFVRTNVKGSVSHWPIPENFWPTSSLTRMPPRNCHPVVKFQCHSSEAMVIDNMPFDKYELEPSPLTQYILERKQPNVAWQTFIPGSSPSSELGYPFGYLKAATNLLCVNLFVMPYNYTVIMPLLDELFKVHKCKPTAKWRQSFEEYLQTMPSYYSNPLRNALRRMGAPNNLIPDHYDGSVSYSVLSYLKKVKHQAKMEAERLSNLHSQQHIPDTPSTTLPVAPQLTDGKLKDFKKLLIQKTSSAINNELYKRLGQTGKSENIASELFANRHLPHPVERFQAASYKNPFDMNRDDLLPHLDRMRRNFFHLTALHNPLHDEDSRHRISIAQMGNYQDHVNQNKPLREVDPSQARVHTFGNPFKLKQDQIIAVDEADVNDNMAFNQNSRKRGGDNTPQSQKNKRKRSETPPPSRRAIGPPNTPPPNVEINTRTQLEQVKQVLQDMKKTNGNDLAHVKKELEKKTSKTVNQQLRKLQELHRNKKSTSNDKQNDALPENKFEETSDQLESDSPILEILRTSLVAQEDKDEVNHEISEINNTDRTESPTPSSGRGSTVSNVTPMQVVSVQDLPPQLVRKARVQLQKRKNVKIRLAIWNAIRERNDFTHISSLLQQLLVSDEAKYIFLMNLVDEADRFQLDDLCAKIKRLLPRIRHTVDS